MAAQGRQPFDESLPASHAPADPPPMRRLLNQFVMGMVWFALLSAIVAGLTGSRYLLVLPTMLCVWLVLGGLTAYCLMQRVSRSDFRWGRFSIASLMLLMVPAGVFLAAVRWLVLATAERMGYVEPVGPLVFLLSGVGMLVVCFASVVEVAGMLDSLVWWAIAWLRRRQRSLLPRQRDGGP